MKNIIVIEGDNGSGKSTLAHLLNEKGVPNVSEDDKLKKSEAAAKQLHGMERIEAFYQYNFETARTAVKKYFEKPSIIVRYWVSTLAAGYADGIFDEVRLTEECHENLKRYPKPFMYIYLKCNYCERVRRIKLRQMPYSMEDNLDNLRSKKYQQAIKYISFASTVPWLFIPADELQPNEIMGYIEKFFKAGRELQ